MKNILLVEDNLNMIDAILKYFNNKYNFFVYKKYSVINLDLSKIDLIIMDMNLSDDENGIDFIKEIKQNDYVKHIPVIMISANNDYNNIIKALKYGANDFICKPFKFEYFAIKIRNFLKLQEDSNIDNDLILKVDNIYCDISSVKVMINDKDIHLTKKEFLIFRMLVQKYNHPVKRDDILACLNQGSHTTKRVVDTHVLNIRKKIPSEYSIKCINGAYSLTKPGKD